MSSCYYDLHRICVQGNCCCENLPTGVTDYPQQQPRWERDQLDQEVEDEQA